MEQEILEIVNKNDISDSRAFAKELNFKHLEVVGALKSLEADGVVELVQKEEKGFALSEEGQKFAKNG